MTASVLIPSQPAHEAAARDVFLALMWGLSYPGREQQLADVGDTTESLQAIGHALLDLETSFFAGDERLERALSRTGARHKPVATASYVFFTQLGTGDLPLLESLSVGDFEYPDNGATLIVGCELGAASAAAAAAPALCLSGPGIAGEQQVRVGGLPEGFWALRERLIHYPLGIDVFLVSRSHVIGLPRTTKVQPCM